MKKPFDEPAHPYLDGEEWTQATSAFHEWIDTRPLRQRLFLAPNSDVQAAFRAGYSSGVLADKDGFEFRQKEWS